MTKRLKRGMNQQFWRWYEKQKHELDLNDSGVSAKAGIAHSVISKAKSEDKPIGVEALSKIAVALNTPVVSVLQIAGVIPADEAPGPEKAEFLRLFEAMTDDDQEEILALVRVKAKRNRNKQSQAQPAEG